MSDLAPELALAEATRKLERMWDEAFPPLAQRTDALIFRGEQEWTKKQDKHLPLTWPYSGCVAWTHARRNRTTA
jgi:hypothetical protein